MCCVLGDTVSKRKRVSERGKERKRKREREREREREGEVPKLHNCNARLQVSKGSALQSAS